MKNNSPSGPAITSSTPLRAVLLSLSLLLEPARFSLVESWNTEPCMDSEASLETRTLISPRGCEQDYLLSPLACQVICPLLNAIK